MDFVYVDGLTEELIESMCGGRCIRILFQEYNNFRDDQAETVQGFNNKQDLPS